MSNELIDYNTELENIQTTAQEDAGFEKILKYKKGQYFVGENQIPLDTKYLAHVRSWSKCWIKFRDGGVLERHVYRVARGERPPERDELDEYEDKSLWEEGPDGKPSDPWVPQSLLPLEDPESGEVVIFATPSTGGNMAVAELCTRYVKRARRIKNSGQPFVKLQTTTFHSRKWNTDVPRPLLEVDGWDDPSADVEIMPPDDTPPSSSSSDFADEIPF